MLLFFKTFATYTNGHPPPTPLPVSQLLFMIGERHNDVHNMKQKHQQPRNNTNHKSNERSVPYAFFIETAGAYTFLYPYDMT